MEKRPFKKLKTLAFLASFISKIKKLTFQIFRRMFLISENLTYMGQPLLKLRAAQLVISFCSTSDFRWEIFKLPVSTF